MTQKRQRGGNVKKNAPPGYYTAQEAAARLGLNRNTFYYYVKTGKIKRHVPPTRTEGFYRKKDIDEMALQIALYFHTHVEEQSTSETRVARPEDAQGIYDVLASFGWKTATVAQRLAWYKVNPFIDYVVIDHEQVIGYITAVPYTDAAMADMMSGRKRAWDIRPEDIRPYRPGTYDLYTGIATRREEGQTQNLETRNRYAFRLIAGFFSFMEELAAQDILIRRFYAVSAEPPGQRLSRMLGFVELEAQPGDLFPRFVLDLETSDSHFARLYRQMLAEKAESTP